ncbi:MAG: septum formation initiator family protein [Hyphomonadaceae bacterium]|nr:septum formation initiator family protein [Hyphomonadaceae bacterium]
MSAFLSGLRDVGGRWFTPAALAIILVLAVGVFKAKTDAAAARKRIADLESQVASQREEVRSLAAEVQYLESPRRLESLSRRELGMAPATRAQKQSLTAIAPGRPAPASPVHP